MDTNPTSDHDHAVEVLAVNMVGAIRRTLQELYYYDGFSQRKLARLFNMTTYQIRKTVGARV